MASHKKIMILIAGNAGHGKDALGEHLRAIIAPWLPVRHDSFAHTLKLFAHQAFGTPWRLLNGNKVVKESTKIEIAGDPTDVTIRECLQDMGQWFRNRFDKRIWANCVKLRAQQAPERVTVITDCRYPDVEIHWIREVCSEFSDVYHVRIKNESVPVSRGHPSENEIADASDDLFDFIVDNSGSMADLHESALQVASAVAILDKTGKRTLGKQVRGWLVLDDEGKACYEPLLEKEEAESLVASGKGYILREVTFDRLRGNRVG